MGGCLPVEARGGREVFISFIDHGGDRQRTTGTETGTNYLAARVVCSANCRDYCRRCDRICFDLVPARISAAKFDGDIYCLSAYFRGSHSRAALARCYQSGNCFMIKRFG